MTEKSFQANLMRFIAAELYFSVSLQAAQEMFGKSYFALLPFEKSAVDQAVGATVTANYQGLTPEFLDPGQPQREPVGFQSPRPEPKGEAENN